MLIASSSSSSLSELPMWHDWRKWRNDVFPIDCEIKWPNHPPLSLLINADEREERRFTDAEAGPPHPSVLSILLSHRAGTSFPFLLFLCGAAVKWDPLTEGRKGE